MGEMLLHDYVDYHARETPDAEFTVIGDQRVSYGEANDQINRLAKAFVDAGIDKGKPSSDPVEKQP
jgi:non-ribosomal peptide synthetase component E (peptide arylation enzyme)